LIKLDKNMTPITKLSQNESLFRIMEIIVSVSAPLNKIIK